MHKVSIANRHGDMGSLGDASNKFIAQHQFPLEYQEDESLIQADHDRMFQWDFDYTRDTFKKHLETGELYLPTWVKSAKPEAVMALLKDLFKVQESHPDVEWTGYRITGTVNRSNGYPVYSLWLFSKTKGSGTKVYSGSHAPNVSGGDSHREDFFDRKDW